VGVTAGNKTLGILPTLMSKRLGPEPHKLAVFDFARALQPLQGW
jgi:hypothetical protein